MKNSVSPKVKIHCWGGLGSQLLAVGLILDLRNSHPRRRFELIIHSSGVTRRVSEIGLLSDELQITFIDYYLSNSDIKRVGKIGRYFHARYFLKFLLNLFRVVITKDSMQFRLYPWTRSIRCHYGLTSISRETIRFIYTYIPETHIGIPKSSEYVLGVHFRSGDLLSKKNSSVIDLNIITGMASRLMGGLSKRNACLLISSDSNLDQSQELLLKDLPFIWQSRNTWETFNALLKANGFIGTNSKISLWVALFRWAQDVQGEVFLPKSLYEQFERITNLSEERKSSQNFHSY